MTPLGIHILHSNPDEMQGPGVNYRTDNGLRTTTFRNKHPMRGYPQEVLLGFTRAPNTIAHGCRLVSSCFFVFTCGDTKTYTNMSRVRVRYHCFRQRKTVPRSVKWGTIKYVKDGSKELKTSSLRQASCGIPCL